jgi:hypothetical protein
VQQTIVLNCTNRFGQVCPLLQASISCVRFIELGPRLDFFVEFSAIVIRFPANLSCTYAGLA